MATIIFDRGDVFVSPSGTGLVLDRNNSVLVTGDNRRGWKIAVTQIPADAVPANLNKLDSSIQNILKGAAAAKGIALPVEDEDGEVSPVEMDLTHITFEFEGSYYQLPISAQHATSIQLPDGRVLSVDRWLEKSPPVPSGLTVVQKATIPVAVQI